MGPLPGLICRWPSGRLQTSAKWRPLVWTHRALFGRRKERCSGGVGAGLVGMREVKVVGRGQRRCGLGGRRWLLHASLVSALFPFPWKTNTGQPAWLARPSPWGESANLFATRCRAISAGETKMRSTVELSVLASCSACLSVLLCVSAGWATCGARAVGPRRWEERWKGVERWTQPPCR